MQEALIKKKKNNPPKNPKQTGKTTPKNPSEKNFPKTLRQKKPL